MRAAPPSGAAAGGVPGPAAPSGLVTGLSERRTTRWAPLAPAGIAGVLAGIVAKAGDESGWRWAADLGNCPAAWVLAVALIGWSAPSAVAAALRSGMFFAAMTVAYYAWAAEVLDVGWDVRLLVAWLLLSATAVPVTGAGVQWAPRRAGWFAGGLLGVPAEPVLGSGAARQTWLIWTDSAPDLPAVWLAPHVLDLLHRFV
jgi:hypothetical protein